MPLSQAAASSVPSVALINNPAVYAPIDTSRLQPRFFGLIKPTPQDGIRVNRELGGITGSVLRFLV